MGGRHQAVNPFPPGPLLPTSRRRGENTTPFIAEKGENETPLPLIGRGRTRHGAGGWEVLGLGDGVEGSQVSGRGVGGRMEGFQVSGGVFCGWIKGFQVSGGVLGAQA